MNRGTALKWMDEFSSGKYMRGTGALRTSESHFCPLGMLANFLDPLAWKLNALGIYEWHSQTFFLPMEWMKKCKIKTKTLNYISNNGYEMNFVEFNDSLPEHVTSDLMVLRAIETYYEQF